MSIKTKAEMAEKLARLARESLKRGFVETITGDGETCYQIGETFEGASLIISHDLSAYDLRFNGESAAYVVREAMYPHMADYYRGMNEAVELTLAHCENQERIKTAARPAARLHPMADVAMRILMDSFSVNSDGGRYIVGFPDDEAAHMTILTDLSCYDLAVGDLVVWKQDLPKNATPAEATTYYQTMIGLIKTTLRITDAFRARDFLLENEGNPS